jgi:hypothetical protein
MLGATACSSTPLGAIALPSADAADETSVGGGSVPVGVVLMPPDAGGDGDATPDVRPGCGTGGICGSVLMPPAEAGEASDEAATVGGGITVTPDAFFGVVIRPEAGFDQ